MAKLFFRYGAMNSGKSALLMQAAHNYEDQGMKVIVIKPSTDTKKEKKIVSRIGLEREVDFICNETDNLYEYIDKLDADIKCVFVDEAQFLTRKQVDELLLIVVKQNIPVICYGLRTDFKGNGFPGSTRLLEVSHTIEEMKTICKCGKKAMFNARKINNKFTFSGEQVAIDGKSLVTYEPLCSNCYLEKLEKYKKLQKQLEK